VTTGDERYALQTKVPLRLSVMGTPPTLKSTIRLSTVKVSVATPLSTA